MDTRVFKAIFIILGGALLVVLFLHLRGKDTNQSSERVGLVKAYEAVVMGGYEDIPVSVADTQEEREKGLSGTTSLPPKTGKLFIFDTPGMYGFWMKDMAYSIDIVWINKDFNIIDVSANISPDTYPKAFFPDSAVKYVLEINAGEAEILGLEKDVPLTIKNGF